MRYNYRSLRAQDFCWNSFAPGDRLEEPRGLPAGASGAGRVARPRSPAPPGPLAASGPVTFGIASDGLVAAQEKLTSSHARDLARALYLREVALLRMEPGLQPAELESLLRAMSASAARDDPRPLSEELTAGGVTHVRVESVDFSQVRLTDETRSGPAPRSLWDDLLRTILAGHVLSSEGRRLVESGEAANALGIAPCWGGAAGARRAAGVPEVRQAEAMSADSADAPQYGRGSRRRGRQRRARRAWPRLRAAPSRVPGSGSSPPTRWRAVRALPADSARDAHRDRPQVLV